VLGVRLDGAGDVLMTTPALCALAESAPGRAVDLLTSPAGALAAELVPELDEVIAYQPPWMKPAREPGPAPDGAMIERLSAAGYDAAVVFTVYSQSPLPAALLCHLAGIPLRLAHCRENPYELLSDWVPETEPERGVRHEARRQLDLVAAVGAVASDERLSLAVPADARRRVRRLLAEAGLADGAPWIPVHPGARAPSRRYPPESYAEAVRVLAGEHGYRIAFSGDAGEAALVDWIRDAAGRAGVSFAGRLRFAELAALVAEAPLLVAGNTGPVHVAAAVGTPVVDLYALTNPQHTPWAVSNRVLSHDVPCRWCYKSICPEGHHNCLRLVEPRQVVAAALELLSEDAGVPAARHG